MSKKISPFLWFENQAEEAANFYTSIFKNSKVLEVTPMAVTFQLEDEQFIALNGGPHFKFNESISFYVNCKDQDEVDDLWEKLIAGGGEPSQCGWLKDKYGLSWQIIPTALPEMLGDPDPEKSGRVVQAMLKMQKIEVKGLQDAYKG